MGGTQHFVRATGLPRAGEEHSALLVRTCHVLGGMCNYVQGKKNENLFWGETWLPSQNARTRVSLLYLVSVEQNGIK